MAQDPAFLFLYKDWLVSTAGWDPDIRGWFINLLCHQADKPDGLPTDLESLADLAGVKISQFKRFSVCWKDTLSAQFIKNSKGLYINEKQAVGIDDRRNYKDRQTKRGLVGAFNKKMRPKLSFTDVQWKELSRLLIAAIAELDNIENHEEIENTFKHTLVAYAISIIGNGNANANSIKEELIKEKLLSEESEPGKPKPQSLYPQCVDLYFGFFKGRNDGVPPKFEKKHGEAMKSIIAYLKTIVQQKHKGLQGGEIESKIAESFKHILSNWDQLSDFSKQQVDLCSMNSQINRIISDLKSKKPEKKANEWEKDLARINNKKTA